MLFKGGQPEQLEELKKVLAEKRQEKKTDDNIPQLEWIPWPDTDTATTPMEIGYTILKPITHIKGPHGKKYEISPDRVVNRIIEECGFRLIDSIYLREYDYWDATEWVHFWGVSENVVEVCPDDFEGYSWIKVYDKPVPIDDLLCTKFDRFREEKLRRREKDKK
jgi:hypothetical protein